MLIRATLRILGDDLDPDLATAEIGVAPTGRHRTGDPMPGFPMHRRPTGSWGLDSDLPETASLQEHVARLLDRVDGKQAAIGQLVAPGCAAELYCSCFVAPRGGPWRWRRTTSPGSRRSGSP